MPEPRSSAWTREGTGGDVALPILAGLHRGWVRARLAAEPAGAERARRAVVEVAKRSHRSATRRFEAGIRPPGRRL